MRHPHAGSRTRRGAPVWTIVVAGGSGLRFGERKQFAELAGCSVVEHAVRAAASISDGIVVVVPEDAVADVDIDLGAAAIALVVVAGGASRPASVRCGLAALPDDCATVLVHDAARPLATPALFAAVLDALASGVDAVVPGVPLADTIRLRSGGVIDRDQLVAVQTPQGFTRSALAEAHGSGAEATDDATLVEDNGGTVVVIEGEAANRKITEQADLVAAGALLERFGDRT
jgi:2-C-methyl-D-erythritol 4-phosphate cytidylyltransferase